MNSKNSELPITGGESNPSIPKDIVTGNSVEAAENAGKPATLESGKLPKDFTLPKWLGTNPEILGGQLQDILGLMQLETWFVYILPVTASNGRTAIRITISPPLPNTIGIEGPLGGQSIAINGKPVTE